MASRLADKKGTIIVLRNTRRRPKRRYLVAVVLWLLSSWLAGQDVKPVPGPTTAGAMAHSAEQEVILLLNRYLAQIHDLDMNKRFWSDDAIYMGADGRGLSKDQVLAAVEAASSQPDAEGVTHEAHDVTVRLYGEVAVVTFRLLARVPRDGNVVPRSRQTAAVFVRREAGWQAVLWQCAEAPSPASEVGLRERGRAVDK